MCQPWGAELRRTGKYQAVHTGTTPSPMATKYANTIAARNRLVAVCIYPRLTTNFQSAMLQPGRCRRNLLQLTGSARIIHRRASAQTEAETLASLAESAFKVGIAR